MQFSTTVKCLARGLALAGIVATSSVFAQTPETPAAAGKGTADRYTATAANVGRVSGETITVDLIRWSTDVERDAAAKALASDDGLLETLKGAPNLGYIWRSGSGFGSFVRYAHRFSAADGQHVVLITDSDLNSWKQITPGTEPSFTLIEMIMPASGTGSGKMSLSSKVTRDAANKTLRLEDYASAQVSLRSVVHHPGSAN